MAKKLHSRAFAVQVRLQFDFMAELERQAAAKNLSPSTLAAKYVEEQICRAMPGTPFV